MSRGQVSATRGHTFGFAQLEGRPPAKEAQLLAVGRDLHWRPVSTKMVKGFKDMQEILLYVLRSWLCDK